MGEVADVLRAQADRELLVEIEGHCAPGEFNPQQLSKKRAEAVREMLIGLGISPTALRAVASGIERPLVANDSPQNRAINRRVSFQIVKGALSP